MSNETFTLLTFPRFAGEGTLKRTFFPYETGEGTGWRRLNLAPVPDSFLPSQGSSEGLGPQNLPLKQRVGGTKGYDELFEEMFYLITPGNLTYQALNRF
ncbi:MAG TPA: hypothetical protein VNM22_04595 [Candidatus Limnocylindrales bacterium]|nr:hypothetical protein [Candidatus Limnocylindrales bacterium]